MTDTQLLKNFEKQLNDKQTIKAQHKSTISDIDDLLDDSLNHSSRFLMQDQRTERASNEAYAQVLIIADDPINIQGIQQIMNNAGFKLDSAIGGYQGLQMIKQRGDAPTQTIPMYKLIILDYSMPEIDGPKTASAVRMYIDSKELQMPFICCCTAYD